MPRLRAETCALMRCPKFSTQGGSSQGVESKHYGVQARRRDGEVAGYCRRWAFFSSLLDGVDVLVVVNLKLDRSQIIHLLNE